MAKIATSNIASLVVSFDSKSGEHLQMYDDLFDVLIRKKDSVAEYTVIELLRQHFLQMFLIDSISLKELLLRIFFRKLTRKHLIAIVNTCRYYYLHTHALLCTGKLFSVQQTSATDYRSNVEIVCRRDMSTGVFFNSIITQKLWILKHKTRAIKYSNRLQSIILVYYTLNMQKILSILLEQAAKILFNRYDVLV